MKKPKPFQVKIFIHYSISIITLLIISLIVFYTVFFNINKNEIINGKRQIVLKTAEQLDAKLYEMDKVVSGLIFNKQFRNIIKLHNLDQESYLLNNNHMLDMFVTLDAPKLDLHRIMAYNDTTYYTFVKNGENRYRINNAIENDSYKQKLNQKTGTILITGAHIDRFSSEETPVISVLRNVMEGSSRIGTIEVQQYYNKIGNICEIDNTLGKITVYNPDGELIYPYPSTTNTQMTSDLFNAVSDVDNGYSFKKYNNSKLFISKSEYSGCTTVLLTDLNEVNTYAITSLIIVLICFFLILVITMMIVHKVSQKLSKPLQELNDSIREVDLSNLSISINEDDTLDEIGYINSSFKSMFNSLKCSIAEAIEAKANEERANYLALESQMNPHTIYNTITTIEAVCYLNGDEEGSQLCIAFSKMLRYISDFTQDEYTIGDEIEHLKNYALLMEKRYMSRLNINIKVDPSLYSIVIPKFTLQPFVENSIKHGFPEQSEKFEIDVDISMCNKVLTISITDNGNGFADEQIDNAYRQFNLCDEKLKLHKEVINTKIGNLALNNIYTRFKIMYKNYFNIKIINNNPGCSIVITLNFPND